MSLPQFSYDKLEFYVRQNFEILRDFLKAETPLLGFRFKTITFTSTGTNLKLAHGLGYAPTDLIQTSLIGPSGATLVWNYSLFDKDNLNATITGAVTPTDPLIVRFFLGAYNQ